MFRVYLGLGSNIGDRLGNLNRAIGPIGSLGRILAVSSVYETDPVGMESEQAFYNIALCFDTLLYPGELLKELKKIEKNLGRKSFRALDDREIDIDILLYRGYAYEDRTVKVPHPMLEHRRFALEPLDEIAPTAIHPILGRTVASLLRQCSDPNRVVRTSHALEIPELS